MNRLLLVSFVVCAVLLPPLQIAPGLPTVRPEIFVVVAALVAGRCHVSFGDRIPKLLRVFFGIAVVAIVASYTVFQVPPNGNDLSVFPMLFQYWLVYCFGKGMSDSAGRRLVVVALATTVGLAALIGIAQKLNLAGVNAWLTPVYLGDNDVGEFALRALRAGAPWARAVGTVGDPRHFACLIAFGVGACLSLLLKSKARLHLQLFAVLILFILLLGVFHTASRTGTMAILLQLGVAGILYFRKNNNVIAPLAVSLLLGLLFLLGFSRFADEAEAERLTMGAEEAIDTSGYARIRDLKEPFVKAMDNPLVLVTGMGPAKSVLPGSEHGEIGWVTLRYGLGGLYLYLAILFWSARRTIGMYQAVRSGEEATVAMFFILVLSVWGFYALAESIFKLPQIMSVNMLVIGMVYGFKRGGHRRRSASPKTPSNPRFRSRPNWLATDDR